MALVSNQVGLPPNEVNSKYREYTDLIVAVAVVRLFGIGEDLPEKNTERPDVTFGGVAAVA